MDTNRLVNIVLTNLSLENLKLQEELERIINSNTEETQSKVYKITTILEKIVLNEMSLTKFQSMIQPKNNNENQNSQQDGQI
jgi:hypothetical protein